MEVGDFCIILFFFSRFSVSPYHTSSCISWQHSWIENHNAIEIFIKRIDEKVENSNSECDGLNCVDPVEIKPNRAAVPGEDDEVFVGVVKDESKMQGWRKLKNGITMDSGSAVDITPEDENPEFAIPNSGRMGFGLAIHCRQGKEDAQVCRNDL